MSPDISPELQRLFAAAPFIQYLGIELEAFGGGECTTHLNLGPHHLQQHDFVHAGVMATLADHTAGAAAASLVQPGFTVLTASFTIHLLHAARGESLVCHAKVLRPGKRLSVVECEVFILTGGEWALVSKLTSTVAIAAAGASAA